MDGRARTSCLQDQCPADPSEHPAYGLQPERAAGDVLNALDPATRAPGQLRDAVPVLELGQDLVGVLAERSALA